MIIMAITGGRGGLHLPIHHCKDLIHVIQSKEKLLTCAWVFKPFTNYIYAVVYCFLVSMLH